MGGVNIENTGSEGAIINNYQLDLSKLSDHGDACVIGHRCNNNELCDDTNSYLYGKGGFDYYQSEDESTTDYGSVTRDLHDNRIFIIDDLSISNANFAELSNDYTNIYGSGGVEQSDDGGGIEFPVIILNENGIIRIIKDMTTLNTFFSKYPRMES